MPKTVIITGASSGIGLETALYFFERNWNVVAAMRCPDQRCTPLHDKGLPDLVHMDVTDEPSIRAAIQYAVDKYHEIDVLVNNAGYALYGPFEAASREQIARQYDTNVFGLMDVTRAILPHFRRQQGGVLINVASMAGRISFPLYSLYNSTKWAVEGFSEALHYEMKDHNIRVKIIEPGIIQTDFYGRSMDAADESAWQEAYGNILKRGQRSTSGDMGIGASKPLAVAQVIYRAATDGSGRLRYGVGMDAMLVSTFRRILPEGWFHRILERFALK